MKTILILLSTLFLFTGSMAQEKIKTVTPKTYLSAYPLFVVEKTSLERTKQFYVTTFDLQVIFESTWFVLLQAGGEGSMYVAFMSDDHPTSPPSTAALNAKSGVCFTFQVADSKSVYDELVNKGIAIHYPLKDESWGQKRFGLIDPNGMYVDVVEQTQPQEGYWDQYMIRE